MKTACITGQITQVDGGLVTPSSVVEFSLVDQTETIVTCVPRSTNHDGVLGLRQPRRCVLYILLSVYSEDNRTHL